MSCQTALQINHNIPFLRTLLNDDTMSLRACPFAWLVAPVESVTQLLQLFYESIHPVSLRICATLSRHHCAGRTPFAGKCSG